MIELSAFLSGLVIILTFIIVRKQVKLLKFWTSRGILAGPRPLPFIGSNYNYFFKNRSDLDLEWSQKYGLLYGTFEGSEPILRIADPELIKFIYIKNFQSFSERNHKRTHSRIQRNWLFWSRNKQWSNQRVLITPMFTSTKMKQMFTVMWKCADKFTNLVQKTHLNSITTYMNESGQNNNLNAIDTSDKNRDAEKKQALAKVAKQIDFSKDELMALALDVIGQAFFGLKVDTYQDKTSEFFRKAFAFSNFDVLNFMAWMSTPKPICRYFEWDLIRYEKYEYFIRLSQSLLDNRRLENKPTEKYHDMIQAFLDAYIPEKHEKVFTELDDKEAHYNDNMKHEAMEKELVGLVEGQEVVFRKFDDSEIRAQMAFLFVAGFETTSSSMSFCFYQLAREQEAQQEVYGELKSVLGDTTGSAFDYTQLMSLKKLDAFISETLRIHPPVTESNRMVTCEGGIKLPTKPPIHLPKGCVVGIPVIAVHRNPDFWKDPLKFDMSRFYPENRDKMFSCTYLPFGIGPRNCVGMRFALLNIKTLLARTLIKYKVLPHDEARMRMYPPEYNRHAFFLQLKDTNFKLMPRENIEQ